MAARFQVVAPETQEEFDARCADERRTGHDFDTFTEICRLCGLKEIHWDHRGRPMCPSRPS
jgi:hypothetical protein